MASFSASQLLCCLVAIAIAYALYRIFAKRILHSFLSWIITKIITLERPILYENGSWNHLTNVDMRLEGGSVSATAELLKICICKLNCTVRGLKVEGISSAPVEVKKLVLRVSLDSWRCLISLDSWRKRKHRLLIHFDAVGVVSHSCYADLNLSSLSLYCQIDMLTNIVRNTEVICGYLKLKLRGDWLLKLTGSSSADESASSSSSWTTDRVMLLMTTMYPSFLENVNFTLIQLIANCVEGQDGGVSREHVCEGLQVTTLTSRRSNSLEKHSFLGVELKLDNVKVQATGFSHLLIADIEMHFFPSTSALPREIDFKLGDISSYLDEEEVANITNVKVTLGEADEVIVESERIAFLLTSEQYHKLSKPDEASSSKDWRELMNMLPVVELRVKNVEIYLLGDGGLNAIAMAGGKSWILKLDWPHLGGLVINDIIVRSFQEGLSLSRKFPEDTQDNLLTVHLGIGLFKELQCNVKIIPIKIMLSRAMKEVIERYFFLPSDSQEEEKEVTFWDRVKGTFGWLTRKKKKSSYWILSGMSSTTIEEVEVEVTLQGFVLNCSHNILMKKYFCRHHNNMTCGEFFSLLGNHFLYQAFKSFAGLKNKKMKSRQNQRVYRKEMQDFERVFADVFSRSDPSASASASASNRWKPEFTMGHQWQLASYREGDPEGILLPQKWRPFMITSPPLRPITLPPPITPPPRLTWHPRPHENLLEFQESQDGRAETDLQENDED